jgi:diguanylate cyclase (GGDEF)-like protein/PAS domain S-box-containing protein
VITARAVAAAAARIQGAFGITAITAAVCTAATEDLGFAGAALARLGGTDGPVVATAGGGTLAHLAGELPAPEEVLDAALDRLGEAPLVRPAGPCRESGAPARLAAPLASADGAPVGVWVLEPAPGAGPDDEVLAVLEVVAVQAGAAIGRALAWSRLLAEHQQVSQERSTLRAAFDSSVAPMATLALRPGRLGAFGITNPSFRRMVGYSAEQLRDRSLTDLAAPEDHRELSALLGRLDAGGAGHARCEVRLVRRNGTLAWADLTVTVVAAEAGREPFLIAHLDDITERKDFERRLLVQAHEDPLTGLANRRGLLAHLQDVLSSPGDDGEGGLVLYADLDGFKRINDRYGHAAGDAVLREAARRLRHEVRASDLVARIGGDEFAIVAVGIEAKLGDQLAARIRRAFEVPLTALPETVTVSVGWTSLDVASDADAVLDRADLAMYTDKFRH